MKLDAFREAVLDEARDHARQLTANAEHDAEVRVREATERAREQREWARRQGREAAERDTHRRRAEARRQAREQVLRARRDGLERVRVRALELLDAQRDTPAYRDLMQRLERLARRQLGDDLKIDAGPDAGGLVASAAGRRVDYRLPTLVDQVMRDMGTELAELWRE